MASQSSDIAVDPLAVPVAPDPLAVPDPLAELPLAAVPLAPVPPVALDDPLELPSPEVPFPKPPVEAGVPEHAAREKSAAKVG